MPTRERIMHPVDVDVEVVMDLNGIKDQFQMHEGGIYFGLPDEVQFPRDIRRGLVESWTYCPEEGEHRYTVSIAVDPNSHLFTEEEKAYGYKTVNVRQRHITSTS
jgi:hypothetical protein